MSVVTTLAQHERRLTDSPIAGRTTPVDATPASGSLPTRVGWMLVVAGAYLLAALGGLAISRQTGNVATLWPPNGVLAAILLRVRGARWRDALLAGAVGSIAANCLNGVPLLPAMSISVANVTEVWLVATGIRRFTNRRVLFREPGDVLVLIGASLVAAIAAGAMSATSAQLLSGIPFARIFTKWVLGDVLGLLVVTPIAVIAWDVAQRGPDVLLRQRSLMEGMLLFVVVFGVTLGVFAPGMPPVQFLVMPAVLLASFRLGPLGAALSTVIVAIVGSLGTVMGAQATMSADQVTLAVLWFQLHLAVLFLSALPVGAAMARRSQLEADLIEARDRADSAAQEMAALASVDDLTGLANRRQFLGQLDRMAERARLAGEALTLAMIDIDHFKAINDRHGHAVGDALLVAIGAACRTAVRTGDVIGRLGGEEFAMLMPLTDEETAYRIVDRLREAVAAISLPAPDGSDISVTISIGLAVFEHTQIDRLLEDADRALYLAKARGRNRIASAQAGARAGVGEPTG